jgi:gliding motility-associated-like protein
MKKHLFFLSIALTFLVSGNVFSQCSVVISKNPIGAQCSDVPITYTAVPSAGVINPQYIWVVNGDTITTASTITQSGFATVQIYMFAGNCTDTVTSQTAPSIIVYNVDYTPIVEECNQTKVDVQINDVTSTGGVPPYTYDLVTDDGSLGQQTLYNNLSVSSYPIIVTDSQGCKDTAWINIAVAECPLPAPIQAFTPNGDLINDTWQISNIGFYPENEVFIFDRWGQRVYHKKGYENIDGWDAKYMGGKMPVSTYYYVLKITLEKSEDIVMKGAISIFR